MTTNIVAFVADLGFLVRFVPVHGQSQGCAGAPLLLKILEIGAPVVDKAFEADCLVEKHESPGQASAVLLESSGKVGLDH